MSLRSLDFLGRVCVGAALLAASGCSRTAVVVAPESTSHADEPAAGVVARAQEGEGDGTAFRFPDDAGGVLLAKVLPPREAQTGRIERPERPARPVASDPMRVPPLPLPASFAAMPRLPVTGGSPPLRPRLLLDETLGGLPDSPALPESPTLPEAGRVRVPSPDVNEPLPLPILAQPVSDRAPLDDPTEEASAAAAVAASMPSRVTKAPFLKLTLPDPYDHRRAEFPAPSEQREFPVGSPQPPRR